MQHSTLTLQDPAPSPRARTDVSSSVSVLESFVPASHGRVPLTEEEIHIINVSCLVLLWSVWVFHEPAVALSHLCHHSKTLVAVRYQHRYSVVFAYGVITAGVAE